MIAALLIAATAAAPATRYELNIRVIPDQRLLTVEGTVVLPPAQAPSQLGIQLMEQMRDVKFRIAEPVDAPLTLKNLGTSNNHVSYAAELPASKTPIKLAYSYSGGDKTAFVFHVGPEGSYGCGSTSAWYPQLGPVEGNQVHGQSSIAARIRLTIPKDQTAILTGADQGTSDEGEFRTYTSVTEHPVAATFAVNKYKILKSPGQFPVALYTLADRADSAEMLQGIRSVVDKLVEIYGPFPFPSFSLVEVSEESIKGAGFDGAGCAGFMLSGTNAIAKGFNMAFFGHEIGHQWWGNLVTHASERQGNMMMDEALSQYGSLRCVADLLGEEQAYSYRRDRFPGYSSTQSGGNYLAMSLAGLDKKLAEMEDGSTLSHELANEKGFMVYEMLRQEMGDKAFHEGLHAVTSKYAFREIRWGEFQQEIEKAAGRELEWFWNQWCERLGAPSLSLEWTQQSDKLTGRILQTSPTYRLKLPMEVRYADGTTETFQVRVEKEVTPINRKADRPIKEVLIDPHFHTLHYTPELRAWAQAKADESRSKWSARYEG